LLFCGITLKHYAYYNMSRRTQLTTKYLFQVLAQLSENFIFIYLGISLFTEGQLLFKPLFILVTAFGVCVARWAAVFPLSKLINAVVKYRARRRGRPEVDELPHSYQAMLFWAGLRGAVGVALAASLTGGNAFALQATILVVVVLTVIVFGGTTARMLEILGIRTGVVDEAESDDEFDIDFYSRPGGGSSNYALDNVSNTNGRRGIRKQASINLRQQQQGFLGSESRSDSDMDSDSDLPPMRPGARQADYETPSPRLSPGHSGAASRNRSREPTSRGNGGATFSASGAISQIGNILTGTADDHAEWFRHFDDEYIKPALLLQPDKNGGGPA
jgi:solute carrier family 9 (sodium/hydrogen exchanger), member 6/7